MFKNIQIRVEDELKQKAEILFSDLGMDMPTAFRMFLKKSVATKSIPFKIDTEEHFSKEETRELIKLLKEAKNKKTLAGPFINSKQVLNYLHDESVY